MKSIAFLSPHSDDISWSVGCLAADLSRQAAVAELVTVFSVSNYTPTITTNTIEHGTAIRAAEDHEFCKTIGLRYSALGFAEGLVRGYPSVESLFRFDKGSADSIYPEVRDLLRHYSMANPADLVFSPVGLGHHIEHLLCREAALQIWTSERLVFYEDLPYAAWWSEEAIRRELARCVEPSMELALIHNCCLARKKTLAAIYASQFRDEAWQPISNHARRFVAGQTAERLWGTKQALYRLAEALAPEYDLRLFGLGLRTTRKPGSG